MTWVRLLNSFRFHIHNLCGCVSSDYFRLGDLVGFAMCMAAIGYDDQGSGVPLSPLAGQLCTICSYHNRVVGPFT